MSKKKKCDIEGKVWKFIDNHTYLMFFIIITILALAVRYMLLKYPSGDYDMFLKPWFEELKAYGGLQALARDVGNYSPIYMTILAILTYFPVDSVISIKIVSIIFELIGGFFLIKIVRELFKDKKNKELIAVIAYGVYLFLPTVFLNSAYWAQSDAIYTSFVLISLYYLLKKNFLKGLIFWSIAFAFKFQAIFIFPLYILMYFTDRDIKFRYILTVPITVFLLSLPKVIFTGDFLFGFKFYVNQFGTYDNYLTLNLPNIYSIYFKNEGYSNLIETPLKELGTIGLLFTIALFVIIALVVMKKKIKFEKETIIDFALWSILICTFFLPQMHERYLFMGDVIGIIYLLKNRKRFYIPLAIELISLNGYMYLLFSGFAINLSFLSIFFFVILLIYTKDMYIKYFKN